MSKSNLKVPFGLKDGFLFEPRQVPLGKACECVCPGCGVALIAKHAEKNLVTPHFQHSHDGGCISGWESAIHLAAKQLIEQQKRIFVPKHKVRAYVVDDLGDSHYPEKIHIPAGVRELIGVSLEKTLSDIRPDIIATTTNGTRFLIEIANTHFVDDDKKIKVEKIGLPMIEIDVSEIEEITFESLSEVLFKDSGRAEWIYHPKAEIIRDQLISSLRPVLDAATEQAKHLAKLRVEKLAREKRSQMLEEQSELRRLEAKAKKIANYRNMSVGEKLKFSLSYLDIQQNQIPDFLNFKVRFGNAIKDPRVVWQVAIYSVFINGRTGNKFKLDSVADWLEEHFDFGEQSKSTSGHKVAVWDFLSNLTSLGILTTHPKQWFEVIQSNLMETVHMQNRMNRFMSSSVSSFRWATNWPDLQNVLPVAKKYKSKYRSVANWEKMAGLLPIVKSRSVDYILNYYSRDVDEQKLVMQFFAEAGFIDILA